MCCVYWTLRLNLHAGHPSLVLLSCVGLSEDVSGAVNVTVSWTLSGGDSADFYLINITTNAPQTPYGGLLNITTGSVTQHELTGFREGYEYSITIRSVNCGSQEGRESEPLTIRPQGMYHCRDCRLRSSNMWLAFIAVISHNFLVLVVSSNKASY